MSDSHLDLVLAPNYEDVIAALSRLQSALQAAGVGCAGAARGAAGAATLLAAAGSPLRAALRTRSAVLRVRPLPPPVGRAGDRLRDCIDSLRPLAASGESAALAAELLALLGSLELESLAQAHDQAATLLDPACFSRTNKYKEQLRQRKEAEERIAAQNEFLRTSLRGSHKLQALESTPAGTAFVNDAYEEDIDEVSPLYTIIGK
ncbi:hypothetical protein RR46_00444 [Papilio xuthus]|uniref:Uncharacterized protein n=1 Tax=Papilio xuthus TaxID=66420 RepID=A0A0N0P9E0_PAPXU|nr:hypothetical protein RR46_00444 [Papilio xuthus]